MKGIFMSSTRQERLDRKHKCQLLCESCGRWARVSQGQWYMATKIWRDRGTSYVFMCSRPFCQQWRAEGNLAAWEARGMRVMYQDDSYFEAEYLPDAVEE